jgi:hypothetical protein
VCRYDREDIEARLALNLIGSADMPQIALEALEAVSMVRQHDA